ncbi:MAG: C40 family peptidase [Paramuribaculum sp.]|nr:C40 family peptidase [Paramuribaculum sp.]
MKKSILISVLVAFCAIFSSFKAQAVPPLKLEYLPAATWGVESIDDNILGSGTLLADSGEEQPTLQDKLDAMVEELSQYAASYLGTRYRWGATGPKNFDCSGFTSHVFRKVGVELNRTSRMQYTQGQSVDRTDLKPGDLMFFSSPRTRRGVVGHVAIVVEVSPDGKSCTFIHASTTKGITYQKFPDGGYFSRNYIGAKRVLSTDNIAA